MATSKDIQAGPLKVWWSATPSPGNFGDIITPYILDYYGIGYEKGTRSQCDAISTGSIIRFARPGVHVLGSGAISYADRIDPRAKFHWVRGPLTGALVRSQGGDCPETYGDPAMLLPRIFPRTQKAIHPVGLVPHYVDFDAVNHPVKINPLWSPLHFLRAVWACDKIISSSLHGIIAAHAYGIPAAWAKLSDKLTGDDIKFHDHAQAVGMDEMPLSTLEKPVFTLPSFDDSPIDRILRKWR